MPKYDQKGWKDKGDLKIISMPDFKKIREYVHLSDPFYLPMMISFQTGLRRAEVCGPEWSDINFEDNTLKVERIMIGTKVGSYEMGNQKSLLQNYCIRRNTFRYSEKNEN